MMLFMGESTRVFVAHAFADRVHLNALMKHVDRHKLPIHVGPLIPDSADWWTQARQAIDGADCVIICPSPSFMASRPCLAELHYALRRQKPLAQLLVESWPEPATPPILSSIRPLRLDRDLGSHLVRLAGDPGGRPSTA
jgi:hypothetical protein